MLKSLTVVFLFTVSSLLYSQSSDSTAIYYIQLTDKDYNNYSLSTPEDFLSHRALQRRQKQGVELNESDLPVSYKYTDSLKNLGLDILLVSKWFNSVTVKTNDYELIDTITNIDFIKNSKKISAQTRKKQNNDQEPVYSDKHDLPKNPKSKISDHDNYYNYGHSSNQIKLHNGHKLHNKSYRGQGILIAVTDAGYTNTDSLFAFNHLFDDNRIKATVNFVEGGNEVFHFHHHGTQVLSVMAANHSGYMIGSAPEANYVLMITEDPYSETFIEELNWVSGAEFADSIGADIINVSLGYLRFDYPEFDYSYEDMDGNTAKISIAANLAYQKGMIVVAAAGNNRTDEEHPYITAPGDAKNIITVGAITQEYELAHFSSIGPTYDGRIKPELVAIGHETVIQSVEGNFINGNGTSYAAPIITGLTACLWQKYPQKTNRQIMDAVIAASSKYNDPDNFLGYGIPDFYAASQILFNNQLEQIHSNIDVYPNPFNDIIYVSIPMDFPGNKYNIEINDISGRQLLSQTMNSYDSVIEINNIGNINKGIYFLTIYNDFFRHSIKVLKY